MHPIKEKMMNEIIKKWLKDHEIELEEERIEMLVVMLKTYLKEKELDEKIKKRYNQIDKRNK